VPFFAARQGVFVGILMARPAVSDMNPARAAKLIPMILVIHRVGSSIQGLVDSAFRETIHL
jgi:hypothetical protein